MSITLEKELQVREEAYLEFSDEEMSQLGLKKGDKFTWELQADGGVFLRKWKKVEIDFSEFSKEELMALVVHSVENNCTVSESLNSILKDYLSNLG